MADTEESLKWHKKAWKWGKSDPLVAFPIACGLFFMLIAVIAIFCDKQEAARNIIYIAVAFGGACGLILTLRRTEALTRQADVATEQAKIAAKQANTAERNLVVERLTRAVGQLGSENDITVRIGGIYSLEMIARTSQEERGAAIQTMAAFVRNRSPNMTSNANKSVNVLDPANELKRKQKRFARLDVETAVRVLARLAKGKEREDYYIDLSITDLSCVNLLDCDLSGFMLTGVDFSLSALMGVNFCKADLANANFSGAMLNTVNFEGVTNLDTNSLVEAIYVKGREPRNLPAGVRLPPNII